MTAAELVSAYLSALERADAEAVLELFAPGAMVHSPLYGPRPATEFYPELFADTSRASLTLLGVAEGQTQQGAALISFWFHFDWRLPSGAAAPFDVVDLAELAEDGRIATLRIVYDTVDVRPAFERETGSSWRATTDS
ncbi:MULTISPECIES: nuclear transport factor 2 family protein [Kitasatospora]|uniref:Nuclear transport factor 2 family protein n=1 Tax=Kitasatospora cathayae TaxID=3004092 RepID=A0ABY7QFR6_9ACTN|nr:nuclear transport factor 2 family protein [Kitasatospora sp. HUAS 3-15]WBP91317.1 nuclear transport factor 2 family protein [Kitasatospora sp. HUAS 3-15]